MRNFLAEHSGAFDPNEVHILVAAFDKAWETVQASGVVYPQANMISHLATTSNSRTHTSTACLKSRRGGARGRLCIGRFR
jgi:hypothetical protein